MLRGLGRRALTRTSGGAMAGASHSVTPPRAFAAARFAAATLLHRTGLRSDDRGAVSVARRGAAVFPTVLTPSKERAPAKMFNYLTRERLIVPAREITQPRNRFRGDKVLERRREYRALLAKDVEEKLRFFTPEMKQKIFFPIAKNRVSASVFRGNREHGVRVTTRLLCMLLGHLRKRENRHVILEQLAGLKLDPPTDEDWALFTDPQTGDITTGLLYSGWVLQALAVYGRFARTASKTFTAGTSTILYGHVIRHFEDRTLVPSLEEWSAPQGELVAEELVGRPRNLQRLSIALAEATKEVQDWGTSHAQEAIAKLSFDEQAAQMTWLVENVHTHVAALRRKYAFGARVLAAMRSLPECKAVHNSFVNFVESEMVEAAVRSGGDLVPDRSRLRARWMQVSPEERLRYSCFGRSKKAETVTGRKLFIRYCCNDYGFSLAESSFRYSKLNDTQRAALDFPFHLSITPITGSPDAVAFQRFYNVMCERHGLVRSNSTSSSNRFFVLAMRKKWEKISDEEREVYFQHSDSYESTEARKPAQSPDGAQESHSLNDELPPLPSSEDAPPLPQSLDLVPAPSHTQEGVPLLPPQHRMTAWGDEVQASIFPPPRAETVAQHFSKKLPPSAVLSGDGFTPESVLRELHAASYIGNPRRADAEAMRRLKAPVELVQV